MTYTLEQKLAHNAIARALVQGDTVRDSEVLSLGPTPSNPRGLPYDPISDRMTTEFKLELLALRELARMVAIGSGRDAEFQQSQVAIRHGRRVAALEREYNQRRTVRGGRVHESNLYRVSLEGQRLQFEITLLRDAGQDALTVGDWEEIHAATRTPRDPRLWQDLATWLERMIADGDGRLMNTDPDEYVWFWNQHKLRVRGYITERYPLLVDALELLRQSLRSDQPAPHLNLV